MKIKMIDALPKPLKKRDDSTGSNWNARYEGVHLKYEKMGS